MNCFLLYWFSRIIAFLGWLWRGLVTLQDGNAYVTVAWGVYALLLLFLGIRLKRNKGLLYAGLGTLLLVVAKLFLVDLTALDPVWRILLFLCFGGLFLVLSYIFQNLLKTTPVLPPELQRTTRRRSVSPQRNRQAHHLPRSPTI